MNGENGDATWSAMARLSRSRWFGASAAALVVLLAGLGWFLASQVPREPVCGGKASTFWLQAYAPKSPSGPGSPKCNEANEAVRSLGTNCIPVLLNLLRQKDSQWKLRLLALAQKQHVIKIHFIPAPERNTEASRAFIVLGDSAKGAVPELVKLLQENLSPESRSEVEDALTRIGPAAEPALPLLLRAATNSNPRVRANALWALGQIHAQPQWCVPVLMRALSDSDDWARLSAAHALGGFGPEAQPAVPQLQELAKIPKRIVLPSMTMLLQVPFEARNALKKIDPAAATIATSDSPSDEPAFDYGFPTSDSDSSSFPE